MATARLLALFAEIEREFAVLREENNELRRRLGTFEGQQDEAAAPAVPTAVTPQKPADVPQLPSTTSTTPPSAVAAAAPVAATVELAGKVHLKASDNPANRIRSSNKQRINKALYRSQWQKHREFVGHRDGVWEVTVPQTALHNAFATASADRSARLWHLQSSQVLFSYLGHKGSVNSARFHPSEALVCSASGDRTCHVWRVPPLTCKTVDHLNRMPQSDMQRSGSFDSNDPTQEPASTELTSLSSKTPLLRLQGHTDAVVAADWMPGGTRIVCGSWDKTMTLWEIAEASAVKLQSFVGHDQRINNVVAHATEPLALSSGRDQSFRLWDFRKASVLVSAVEGHSSSVTSAVFTRNGTYVVSSSERAIKVWDLKYMKAPVSLIRISSGANRVSVSPVVSTIAAPMDNGEVAMFDLSGGLLARIVRSTENHTKTVCCTAWTRDERRLLSSGWTEDVFSWAPSV